MHGDVILRTVAQLIRQLGCSLVVSFAGQDANAVDLKAASLALRRGFLDFVYFSAITYTTVGFGDYVPTGPIRFLAGTEALTGFLLITWSASFTFLEMQRYWGRD